MTELLKESIFSGNSIARLDGVLKALGLSREVILPYVSDGTVQLSVRKPDDRTLCVIESKFLGAGGKILPPSRDVYLQHRISLYPDDYQPMRIGREVSYLNIFPTLYEELAVNPETNIANFSSALVSEGGELKKYTPTELVEHESATGASREIIKLSLSGLLQSDFEQALRLVLITDKACLNEVDVVQFGHQQLYIRYSEAIALLNAVNMVDQYIDKPFMTDKLKSLIETSEWYWREMFLNGKAPPGPKEVEERYKKKYSFLYADSNNGDSEKPKGTRIAESVHKMIDINGLKINRFLSDNFLKILDITETIEWRLENGSLLPVSEAAELFPFSKTLNNKIASVIRPDGLPNRSGSGSK